MDTGLERLRVQVSCRPHDSYYGVLGIGCRLEGFVVVIPHRALNEGDSAEDSVPDFLTLPQSGLGFRV